MSVVSLLNVDVRNNPAPFTAPYEFEITFECVEQLKSGMRIPKALQYTLALTFWQIWSGSSPMSAPRLRMLPAPPAP